MKTNEKVEVTFGKTNETTEERVMHKVEATPGRHEESSLVHSGEPQTVEVETVEEDVYATAVDALFGEYQTFQEGMQDLPRLAKQPAVMQLKLNQLLKNFQEAIRTFRAGDYEVEVAYQEGHAHILNGLDKYDEFLVEYPKALQGKGGFKAMKKITALGKLSGEGDQDMKAAFRSFEQAIEAGEQA